MSTARHARWTIELVVVCSLLTDVLATIISPPTTTVAVVGSNATFYCSKSTKSSNFISWTTDDNIVPLNSGCTSVKPDLRTLSCAGGTSALTEINVTKLHTFTCTDLEDATYASAAVIVLSALPTCGLASTSVITAGKQVTLTCQIGFTPTSFVGLNTSITSAWSLNGTLVPGSQSTGVTSNNITVTPNGPVFPSFTCTWTISVIATGSSASLNLDTTNITLPCTANNATTIQYCPSNVTIIVVTSNRTVVSGSQIQVPQGENFSCSAISTPASSYYWTLDGNGSVGGPQYTINAPAGTHTLTCIAVIANSTSCGNETNSANITVIVLAPTTTPSPTTSNQPTTSALPSTSNQPTMTVVPSTAQSTQPTTSASRTNTAVVTTSVQQSSGGPANNNSQSSVTMTMASQTTNSGAGGNGTMTTAQPSGPSVAFVLAVAILPTFVGFAALAFILLAFCNKA